MENGNDLSKLIGKKVQINYINPAQEEQTVAGRLLAVSTDIILIDGPVMKSQLARKNMKIVSIDYVEEPEGEGIIKLIIHRKGKAKITADLMKQIGEMMEKGQRAGKNQPKGIDWELLTWQGVEK